MLYCVSVLLDLYIKLRAVYFYVSLRLKLPPQFDAVIMGTVILLVTSLLAVTCSALEPGPIVQTKYGQVQGQIVAIDDFTNVTSFWAIPYIKPPVGDLRFEVT